MILFHAAFAYTSGRTVAEESETSTSVLLFISLIMSLIVVVVSTVALSQKCKVRWASLFSLGVGVNVLVVCIASWVGGLAAATP